MATSVTLTTYPTARNDSTEAKWEQQTKHTIPDGIYIQGIAVSNDLLCYNSSGMTVQVPDGQGIIQGFSFISTGVTSLTIAAAHATLTRKDLVVVHLDRTSPCTVSIKVVTGTASGSPADPALTNNSTISEYAIARVTVAGGISSITAGMVTDMRPAASGIDSSCGSLIKLADNYLVGSSAAFTFTNIPPGCWDLVLAGNLQGNNSSQTVDVRMRVNADTGAIYRHAAAATWATNTQSITEATGQTSWSIGTAPAASAASVLYANLELTIHNYSDTAAHKSFQSRMSYLDGTLSKLVNIPTNGYWPSTAAINSITVFPSTASWLSGSRLTLYGRN